MNKYKTLAACAFGILAISNSLPVTAGSFHINHYQAVNIKANGSKAKRHSMNFRAFGRQFKLDMTPNLQIFANLPSTQKHQLGRQLNVFKGSLANVQGSWVRINYRGNQVSGAIWDGKELYIIDSPDHIADALDDKTSPVDNKKTDTVIYKYSDTDSEATCAVKAKGKAKHSIKGLFSELQQKAKILKAQANSKLDIAVVTDAEFTQDNSSNPQAAVMERMNVVDGIFSEQAGVKINVSEIRTLSNNGPLTASTADTLLTQFSNYVDTPGFNNPGLAHLMTTRDIAGNTVGIAYLDSLCSKPFGVGLSQVDGNGVASALITAHEIGHNFGAPHDNQSGSVCASTAGTFLMNPFITGSKQFSACSLQQIMSAVNRATCLVSNTIAPRADVRPVIAINPINVRVSTVFSIPFEVFNNGTAVAQAVTTRIVLPSSLAVTSMKPSVGSCKRVANTITCTLGNIPANTTRKITLGLKSGATAASLAGTIKVAASNDTVTTNNTLRVAIKIR